MDDIGAAEGLGLAEAIGVLRDELLRAQADGAGSPVQLPIESMTVELATTASRSADGKAGFRVPFVELELGAGRTRGQRAGQRMTEVFSGPVDEQGRPVKIAQRDDKLKG